MGDVVYIEVPSVGDQVKKHDQVGAVESVKAASDIYAPVSGTILKVNDKLESEPRYSFYLSLRKLFLKNYANSKLPTK